MWECRVFNILLIEILSLISRHNNIERELINISEIAI